MSLFDKLKRTANPEENDYEPPKRKSLEAGSGYLGLYKFSMAMMLEFFTPETIDALLARFMSLRFRAQQGGGGVMSWEMYSWLLLRACGCSQNQLLTILQPTMGRFPNTEEEFNAMQI